MYKEALYEFEKIASVLSPEELEVYANEILAELEKEAKRVLEESVVKDPYNAEREMPYITLSDKPWYRSKNNDKYNTVVQQDYYLVRPEDVLKGQNLSGQELEDFTAALLNDSKFGFHARIDYKKIRPLLFGKGKYDQQTENPTVLGNFTDNTDDLESLMSGKLFTFMNLFPNKDMSDHGRTLKDKISYFSLDKNS